MSVTLLCGVFVWRKRSAYDGLFYYNHVHVVFLKAKTSGWSWDAMRSLHNSF